MSRSLIKIIDSSLVPASLMVLGKFLGIVIVISFFDIPTTVSNYTDSIIGQSAFLKQEDITLVTSYSDLVMYLFLSLFFSINLFRNIYFRNPEDKPVLFTDFAKENMFKLIQNSYEIYHNAFVVLVFLWISNILIFVNVFRDITYFWIGLFTIVVSLFLTVILFQDVHNEIENIRNSPGSYKWN